MLDDGSLTNVGIFDFENFHVRSASQPGRDSLRCALQSARQLFRIELGPFRPQPPHHCALRRDNFFDRSRHKDDFVMMFQWHARQQHGNAFDGVAIQTICIENFRLLYRSV